MATYDCETECSNELGKDCQEGYEGDVYDLTTRWGYHRYHDSCGNEYRTEWEVSSNILPNGAQSEEYDEVEQWKYIWLNTWMSDTPGHLLDEDCRHDECLTCNYDKPYEPDPEAVELVVKHPNDHDSNKFDYKIEEPRPQDGSDGNFVEDIILPAAGVGSAVPGHPILKVGAALTAAFIATYFFSSPVSVDQTEDGDMQQIWYTIDLDGDEGADFPQSACDTASVRFTINPGTYSNDLKLATYTRFSYYLLKYSETADGCTDGGAPCPDNYEVLYETSWNRKDYDFDSVSG